MASKGKYFQIKSKSCGHYLDVKGGGTAPGTLVVVWSKTDADNQQWYADPHTRTIRSKLTNLVLDINGALHNVYIYIFTPTFNIYIV